ncbi:Hsp70 family protein [Pandoraea sp. NPDC090278]|uniref:Hsp70 family protein n=1 Tax=Pandoraea sp. NPDC090278 TaxID=3364391 RepID=UPI00383B6FC9
MDQEARCIIGVDLGTTNSLVAVWRNGIAELIPNALGSALTPSCVSVLDDGSIIVGAAARDRLESHPKVTAAVFKRYMGTSRTTRLGSQAFRPEELSAFVLKSLKADAEAFLGHPVTEAVITVPAYFNDAQRKATRAAAELAGLQVAGLLNEPTAAALAYGLHEKNESGFLVFDLGGGTFDVSVLELFEGVMEVRATAGDNLLGGEDFVDALLFAFGEASGLIADLRADKPASYEKSLEVWPESLLVELRPQAERVKRSLTDNASVSMQCEWAGKTYQWDASQDAFAERCEPLLARLRAPVETSLRDARIRPSSLNAIVLAGGATRMPMVRRLVSLMFGRFPNIELDPDTVVALGAAVQGGLKARDAALSEIVMTDVAPYSMGIDTAIEVRPGHFSYGHYIPLIERNTTVPASYVKTLVPLQDGQREIELRVFQGEARHVQHNILLGKVNVPLPKQVTRDTGQVDVRFTYDVNGILEVEAKVLATGQTHRLVIEENPGVLTADEIRERLDALSRIKIHPRDQSENQALISRGERLYLQARGDMRAAIDNALTHFQAALETQDEARIREVRPQIASLLDRIDHDVWQ